jgi:CheY-like chemotaxis protein
MEYLRAVQLVVVDDNPNIRRSYSAALASEGYIVHQACSADEALDFLKAKSSSIDLVLTDVEMSGSMNGLALANLIGSRWPKIRLIVSSGRVHPSADDLPAGARFLPKPNTAAMLMRAVSMLLTNDR